MQSLDRIKRRIKSIQTTSKITGAMKLVATAKMKRLMDRFKVIHSFSIDFYKIIDSVANQADIQKKENTMDDHSPRLWILISSSLGLCGAFNTNVCKFLLTKLQPQDKIIVIGKRGYSYFKSHGLINQIVDHLEFAENNFDYFELLPLCEMIINKFNAKEFTSVHLIYTKFINSLTFNPTAIRLIPFDHSLFQDDAKIAKSKHVDLDESNKEISYEPSKQSILSSAMSTFITTVIYAAIGESRVCENGARRNAMETATDNAKELLDELTLEFNDIRQQNITQEINEIVAGANGST